MTHSEEKIKTIVVTTRW